MTDPRIEAAARSIWMDMQDAGTEITFENASTVNRAMALSLARNALAAADAAAWRPIADCETMRPVLVLQGRRQLVAQKIMDAELSDVPVWRVVEGETNEDSGAYLVYLHPKPTHWQPLPTPPKTPEPTP